MEEIHLPIGDNLRGTGFSGFGHWDRRRDRDVCPRNGPMAIWGRHRTSSSSSYNSRTTRSNTTPTDNNTAPVPLAPLLPQSIPESVRRGFGDMHLDDWISPNELIGSILEDDKKIMELLHQGNGIPEPPPSPTPPATLRKDVFEIKLNVSDYEPKELKVKMCNGLVSIEGRHEEDTKPEHDWRGVELQGYGHISTHFKRTFTLPKNVFDEQLRVNLTEDGHLVLHAPVKTFGAAPIHHSHARLPITLSSCVAADVEEEDKAKGKADMMEVPVPKEKTRKA